MVNTFRKSWFMKSFIHYKQHGVYIKGFLSPRSSTNLAKKTRCVRNSFATNLNCWMKSGHIEATLLSEIMPKACFCLNAVILIWPFHNNKDSTSSQRPPGHVNIIVQLSHSSIHQSAIQWPWTESFPSCLFQACTVVVRKMRSHKWSECCISCFHYTLYCKSLESHHIWYCVRKAMHILYNEKWFSSIKGTKDKCVYILQLPTRLWWVQHQPRMWVEPALLTLIVLKCHDMVSALGLR